MWWRTPPDRLDCRAAMVRALSLQCGNECETICRKCAQRRAAGTQPDLESAKPHPSALILITVMLGAQLVPMRWIQDPKVRGLLVIVAMLVLVQVLDSPLTNLLRAPSGPPRR